MRLERVDQVNVEKKEDSPFVTLRETDAQYLPKLPRRMLCWQCTHAARPKDVCVVEMSKWIL